MHRVETALLQLEVVEKVSVGLKAGRAAIWGGQNPAEAVNCDSRLGFQATKRLQGK